MRSRFPRWGLSVLTMVSVATVVLLVTGWGSAVAASVSSVFVTNTSANPVPVKETSTDANGNIKVAQQGTASVNVTNSAVPVSGSVGITGTPSVKLDSTGNTVQLAPGTSVGVTGTPSVSLSGTPSVSLSGTPSVNVTNDQTQIIAQGQTDAQCDQCGSNGVLIGSGAVDPSQPGIPSALTIGTKDIGSYKSVTLYWKAQDWMDPTNDDLVAYTSDATDLFPLCDGTAQSGSLTNRCNISGTIGSMTFDPAPPNLFIQWENFNTTLPSEPTVDWMLVGRKN